MYRERGNKLLDAHPAKDLTPTVCLPLSLSLLSFPLSFSFSPYQKYLSYSGAGKAVSTSSSKNFSILALGKGAKTSLPLLRLFLPKVGLWAQLEKTVTSVISACYVWVSRRYWWVTTLGNRRSHHSSSFILKSQFRKYLIVLFTAPIWKVSGKVEIIIKCPKYSRDTRS